MDQVATDIVVVPAMQSTGSTSCLANLTSLDHLSRTSQVGVFILKHRSLSEGKNNPQGSAAVRI